MSKIKLSVVLATRNEEDNIGHCLESVRAIADEIIVYDEFSSDQTVEIAEKCGAKVFEYKHGTNFHETKQKAIDAATGEWILQLDADERVTKNLAGEIKEVIKTDLDINLHPELVSGSIIVPTIQKSPISGHQSLIVNRLILFSRHQYLIEKRDGKIGRSTGEVVALFIPRLNYFLGKPLIHAGVYPDGVIRLFKRGKAKLPGKSVHEMMEVDGEVGWLFNDLEHHESPTFSRYLERANRYTDLTAKEFKNKKLPATYWNLFKYSFFIPLAYFLSLYIRHCGYRDGMRGFVWSAFSALHYPIAYFKYYSSVKNNTYPSKL